ncbi:receptor-type tyrosine-protein phosphatase kappa-like isoform X1 [Mytilus californianus]|uniref:receptor-type tyrosine-protein phosphatase kappa-like isoform X1 n=1 Tax=Mytilus californianus TaxID=6549 RepID=UPI002245960C|nr:receptor-type tyrosine-protein phosphatase kappa-like isoform X1 [Mytilus californianus]
MNMMSKLQPHANVFLIIIAILFVPLTAQINLALHGTPGQETTYTDTAGISYNASLAIKGPANNNWKDGCSSTAAGQATQWWGMSFPKLVYITNIKYYLRNDKAHRMNGFRLYLANDTVYLKTELCYVDIGKQAFRNLIQSVDCDLSPTKDVYFFNRKTFVELCYIEIYGCWKGTWGTNCTTDCPVECIDRHCYPANGSCIWGCDVQKCYHGVCDANTDVCSKGCVAGEGGRYCTFYNTVYNGTAKHSLSGLSLPATVLTDGNTTSCINIETTSSNSYIQIGNESLIVITGVYLFFGDNTTTDGKHEVYCSNTTDTWIDGTMLYNAEYNNEDIDVFAVCKYIFYLPPILNENTKIDICEIEIGGCPYGKYGDSCKLICPKNCMGLCDLTSGNCMLGCLDGWLGEKCDIACDEGKFGSQCLRDCSSNCLSSPCDPVTGQCKAGCMKGLEGFNCTDECSNGYFGWNCSETCNGCIADECNHINGVCINDSICKPGYVYGKYCNQTCEDWHFGTNCNKMCNCLNISCNTFTGKCPEGGCKKGWRGDSCDQECTHGYFGFNCIQFCGTCYNNSCNKLNGSCEAGCKGGFIGSLCAFKDNQESPSGPGPAVGGSISGVIIVITLVVLAVIIYRRRSTSQNDKYLSDNEALNKQAEGNTYFNHEIIQNKEEGYANMSCETSVDDVQISLPGTKAGKVRYNEENDQLPEEEEYNEGDEGDLYTNIAAEQTKHKISISDLKKVINEKRKDEGFHNEYKIFPKGLVRAHEEGSKEENKLRNRFLKTWPYDHSRIILTGNTKHDYINASYIDSYDKERAYIASQGPKKNTLRDFWHMIWQEKVGKIVMVTKLEEERRKKCEQYWPQSINKAMPVDSYRLVMKKEIQHTVYVYRLFILQNNSLKNKQERKVHHFHFTQWPDHGVPDSVKLVNFYRKVKSIKVEKSTPMVVHCSAGVGRTGTFIAVDALYEHGKKVGYVDIMEYVQMMRKDRMNMIQTHEQYAIVFEALLELFTVPDTSIQKNNFCEYIQKQENKTKNQTIYRKEFQRLRTLRPSYSSDQFTSASSKENKSKNSTTVLAHDRYRPYLMSYGKTRSDYINTVIIPGYAVGSKMFVTQCPLVETVIDFWTMMYDHSSRIIVLLDPGNKGAPLWLEKKEMLQFDDFRIIKETENAQEELQLTLNHTKNKEQISINVFTADDWTTSNAPPSPEYMLDLLQRVQNCWETEKVPITVVCSDGCSKSGLFVALRLVLEKMQIDEEIDIFQVVREIQKRRPEFLTEFDQYEYCYKCIKELLDGDSRDSLYANI